MQFVRSIKVFQFLEEKLFRWIRTTSEAQQEKEQLITELREDLEVTSRSTTSEQLNQVADNLQENLRKVPNFLYIG